MEADAEVTAEVAAEVDVIIIVEDTTEGIKANEASGEVEAMKTEGEDMTAVMVSSWIILCLIISVLINQFKLKEDTDNKITIEVVAAVEVGTRMIAAEIIQAAILTLVDVTDEIQTGVLLRQKILENQQQVKNEPQERIMIITIS